MATQTPTTPTTYSYTIKVWGRYAGQDHTYYTNNQREAYATRDSMIAAGYTAIVDSPFVPR